MSVTSDSELTLDSAQALVQDAVEVFERACGHAGQDARLVATVIVMPNLSDFEAIDLVQQQLKDVFVSKGLMLGQFYPGCPEPGLWNEHFRPLDTPHPMLAIRHMVPSDYPFLMKNASWFRAYLKRFAADVPAKARSMIAEALHTGSAAPGGGSVA